MAIPRRRATLTERVSRLERPITARRIGRRAITTAKLAENAVTSSKLAPTVIPEIIANPLFNQTIVSVLPNLIATPAFDKVVRNVLPEVIAHPTFNSAVRTVLPELVSTPAFAQAIQASVRPVAAEVRQRETNEVLEGIVSRRVQEIQLATGPQGPAGLPGAVGPQGLAGLTGAEGPQGMPGPASLTAITDVRFAGSNEPVPFTAEGTVLELNFPPIVLQPNQVVKLDAFANVDFTSVQEYTVNSFLSRNPNDIITVDNAVMFQEPNQPDFAQVAVTANLTWVDSPGPGSYSYSFTIVVTTAGEAVAGSINSRGFTATVLNIGV